MTATAMQRQRDAAFFEDWSEWRDLGSRPRGSHISAQMGYRPASGAVPHYHCLLRHRLPHDGRPGFEMAVPQSIRIARLLKSVPGAYEPRFRSGPYGAFDEWYVPAESWEALRAVLPAIKAAIGARR